MAVASYTSLVEAVKEILEDDSAEVSAFIPTAIFLAEEVLVKDLDMSRLENEVNLSVQFTSARGNKFAYASLVPVSSINDGNFLYFNHLFQNGRKLKKVDYSYIEEFNRAEGATYGTSAEYWAFKTTPSVICIAPKVSGRVTGFRCNYTRKPVKLNAANPRNEFTRSAPDLLLYQTMCQMATFTKHWETLNVWKEKYMMSLQSHLNTTRRERKEVGQMVTNDRDANQSTTGNK